MYEWSRTAVPVDGGVVRSAPFDAGGESLRRRDGSAVILEYGDLDAYEFHTLGSLRCMVERRKGGETAFAQWSARWRGGRNGGTPPGATFHCWNPRSRETP
jgi:hypothetical protein